MKKGILREIYKQITQDSIKTNDNVSLFAMHTYKKYPNAYRLCNKTLINEAKAFKLKNSDIKKAVITMLKRGDVYLTKNYKLVIVK